MWNHWNTCALLAEVWTRAAAVENGMAVPQKINTRTTVWPSNFTSEYIKLKSGMCTCLLEFLTSSVCERWASTQSSQGETGIASGSHWFSYALTLPPAYLITFFLFLIRYIFTIFSLAIYHLVSYSPSSPNCHSSLNILFISYSFILLQ